MTKSDLIEYLCQVEKLPKGRAELVVNTIFDCLEASLRRGERIEIRGFGSFEIRNYRAYQGRNPRTGSTVAVKPKRLPFFKVGKELKERVNEAAGSDDNGTAGSNGNGAAHTNGNGSANGNGHGNGHGHTAAPAANGAAPAETPAAAPASAPATAPGAPSRGN
jgi:integration host factor subunit beta